MAVTLGVSSGFVEIAPTVDPNGGATTTIDGSSVVTKHTSPAGATKITEIGWYRASGTNSANFEVGLYAESGGIATTRLYVDNTNSSTSSGWIRVTVDWAISENTPYWLAVQMDAHSGSSTIARDISGGAGYDIKTSQTTLTDPYGGGTLSDADGLMAIYALVNVKTDNQPIYLNGQSTSSDNQPIYLGGGIVSSDNQPIYLKGQISLSDNQQIYLKGQSTLSDNQSIYINGAEAAVYEYLVPDSDITVSNWKDQNDGTSNLYTVIDETTYNDSDYIYILNPSGYEYAEFGLSNPSGIVGNGDVRIRWRMYDVVGSGLSMRIQLRQGASGIIATTDQALTNSLTSYSYLLTSGEVSSISNWNDLRLRVTVVNDTEDMLLKVSTTNNRYVTNQLDEPVILCGFHTWYNIQDGGEDNPPDAFDWDDYADSLVSYGCNFTKLWASMETAQLWADPLNNDYPTQYFRPERYERSETAGANDGGNKFDLTQINSTFLSRLVARVADLQSRGIYACIQLFQGWQIETKGGTENPATYHPYLAANNINSLDGDFDDDGELTETHTDTYNEAWSYQQDFIEAIIDAVNEYDNIFYEVSNEDTGSTDNTVWQEDVIDYIQAYEATKPKQHLIMRTVCYPNGSNAALDISDAQIVSYNGDKADDVLDGDKVAMRDSDHVEGIATDYDWVWPAFCNGSGGVWYMDVWNSYLYEAGDTRVNPTYIVIRKQLGYVVTLANLCNNLLLMTPQPSLSTSGYCLARDHATAGEYVCYYDGSSTFNLNLSNATGTLNIRWLRCSDGTVQDTATVSGGAIRTLTPPWTGRVVAYVRHT